MASLQVPPLHPKPEHMATGETTSSHLFYLETMAEWQFAWLYLQFKNKLQRLLTVMGPSLNQSQWPMMTWL